MLEQAFMKVKMFFPFSKIKIFVSHLHPSPSPIKDTLYNASSKSGRRRVVLVGLHQACRSLKNVRVGIANPSTFKLKKETLTLAMLSIAFSFSVPSFPANDIFVPNSLPSPEFPIHVSFTIFLLFFFRFLLQSWIGF